MAYSFSARRNGKHKTMSAVNTTRPLWPPKQNVSPEDLALAAKLNRFIDAVLTEDFLRELDHIFCMKAEQELQALYGWGYGVHYGPVGDRPNEHYLPYS